MEHRTLIINVISAKDLNKVNFITKMNVYAVVYISGGGSSKKSKQKTKTHVDKVGGSNPTWNFPMKFNIDESAAHQNRLTLVFNLKCDRVLGDKDIGEVHVPIVELMQSVVLGVNGNKENHFVSYQVRKPNGKPKGQISISYTFGGKVTTVPVMPLCLSKGDEPLTAYPVAANHTVCSSAYPPPPGYGHQGGSVPIGYDPYPHAAYHQSVAPSAPAGYGYPPPPPAYSEYPPPPSSGYGYPPQPQPPRKNKFGGLGLGAGLLGGAIGGLLIGDMVSDGFDF